MSFFDDQEEDWFANDCKGAPSDYYAGELAPWLDHFTDTSATVHRRPSDPKRSPARKRREQRKRAEARKKAAGPTESHTLNLLTPVLGATEKK